MNPRRWKSFGDGGRRGNPPPCFRGRGGVSLVPRFLPLWRVPFLGCPPRFLYPVSALLRHPARQQRHIMKNRRSERATEARLLRLYFRLRRQGGRGITFVLFLYLPLVLFLVSGLLSVCFLVASVLFPVTFDLLAVHLLVTCRLLVGRFQKTVQEDCTPPKQGKNKRHIQRHLSYQIYGIMN